MYIKDYIQATSEVLKKEHDPVTVLHALKKYLERRGLTKLYPAILRGIIEKNRRSERSSTAKVTIARNSDFVTHESDILKVLADLDQTKGHQIHVDETLIGGYIIKSKDKRIDNSYKSKLLHTYRSLID